MTGYTVRLPHLPPMTEQQFANHMAAQAAQIAAGHAARRSAYDAGAAAYVAGQPYAQVNSAGVTTEALIYWRAWQEGWSDACGEVSDDEASRIVGVPAA